ncbi:MAG: sulfite reductase flavoprotein subunit alpha [Spongiibacteraceae bacterium]
MPISQQLFSDQQWGRLNQVLLELDKPQSLWLSGYLAASATGHPITDAAATGSGDSQVIIAFGTETDNCRKLATQFAQRLNTEGIAASTVDLATLRLRKLSKTKQLVIITATHGDGDPPEPIISFYEGIMADDAPKLSQLKFAVLALGDSSYEHFCVTGISLDQRLEALGGQRLIPRQDCDVDFEKPAAQWLEQLLKVLPRTTSTQSPGEVTAVAPAKASYSKDQPLTVEVLANQNLSNPNRAKPIYHLELSLDAPDFVVEPGDAVGITPNNPPELVAMVLDTTGLSGEQPVTVDSRALPLVEVLRQYRDLTIPSRSFLELWAVLSGAEPLIHILSSDNKTQRQFLREHQIRDLLLSYPARPEAQALADALRPLQPRLYDVANSLASEPDELHLTVKAFEYPFGNRLETGIASQYLLDLQPGDSIQLYPHRNARFRLPESPNTPLILIADGTGIAPYRAFLQALAARDTPPPCWLIFADKHFEDDFLYQVDVQQAHQQGVLTHVDTTFYNDQPDATLATCLLRQAKRLHDWLARDAHVYLCGDKPRLESCEAELKANVDQQLGEGQWQQWSKAKRIHRNLY